VFGQDSEALSFVELPVPIPADISDQLRADDVELLHHFGRGRYLVRGEASVGRRLSKSERPKPVLSHELTDATQKATGDMHVEIVIAHPVVRAQVQAVLAKAKFTPDELQVEGGVTISGWIAPKQMSTLQAEALILHIAPAPAAPQPLNFESRVMQSVTPLNSGLPGAPQLNGTGTVIGLGDGGTLSSHPDATAGIVHSTHIYNPAWGNHPDHVAGTLIGTGAINPKHRGSAPGAELVVDYVNGITFRAPGYYRDFGMTLTNNSYGPSFNCVTAGRYSGGSASIDRQLYDHAPLLHVFAAGNSGRSSCDSVPKGYGTLVGGDQNAKNALTVGNATINRVPFRSTSAGPTADGRLKPELSAIGTGVTSLGREDDYTVSTGTSMASPNVAASLALLTQRFRELHPEQTISGALLKAVACNTAADISNPGPDYKTGFGLLEATRALDVLEAEAYLIDSVASEEVFEHELQIPEGVQQLKSLLYWVDAPGSTEAGHKTLVNDLDLYLVSPQGDTLRPLRLDHNNPEAIATPGIDTLNNIEQVVLNNPEAGTYSLHVHGKELPFTQSHFVLTWDVHTPALMLTSPYGGEVLEPGQTTLFAWTASAGDWGSWKLEAREPSGEWHVLRDNIAWVHRGYSYTVPDTTIAAQEYRISNSTSELTDTTNAPVAILGCPKDLSAKIICEGGAQLSWGPVEAAAGYRVYQHDGERMRLIAETADTSALILDPVSTDYRFLSVSTINEYAAESARAIALKLVDTTDQRPCTPLPAVDWAGLHAEQAAYLVGIDWAASNDYQVLQYSLERSISMGPDSNWTLLTRLPSNRARGMQHYTATDEAPQSESSIYYRVRRQLADSTEQLSEVVELRVSPDFESPTAESEVEVEPEDGNQDEVSNTPSSQGSSAKHHLQVYDLAGRLKLVVDAINGQPINGLPEDLPKGIYVMVDPTSGGAVRRFVH